MITCDSLVYQPFQPTGGALACDGVSIQSIVEHAGTPTYIYSARAIRDSYRAIDDAFASYPHAIHYALKANSTLAIVRLLRSLGSRPMRTPAARSASPSVPALRAARHRLHGRRQDARRARVRGGRAASGRSTRNRPASSIASRRSRVRRGAWRAWRSASTPTSTRRAIRTFRPASRRTSSASRCRTRAPSTARGATRKACSLSACTSTSVRRSRRSSR